MHSGAIHELKKVIQELAEEYQVIISTHCPIFVNREEIKANILISDNEAHPSKSIEEIRKLLGVQVSDNLKHAEAVLVVEGESDKIILQHYFSHKSPSIKAKLQSGSLAFEVLNGASNLNHKIGDLQRSVVSYHVLLQTGSDGNF